MMTERTIDGKGIIRLPRALRARLRLAYGGHVMIEPDGDGFRLRPVSLDGRPRRHYRQIPRRPVTRLAEYLSDLRIARRRHIDPNREVIPLDQVKKNLGL
jgi:bifunctional DNA-binding transcriptional regulator/antitoxin component of YhaV-PrlF toxin-antitoxin module